MVSILEQKIVTAIHMKRKDAVTGMKKDLDRILQYIDGNYSRNTLSLEEVAEYGGFSKTYFSQLFKQEVGISYIQYLSEIRFRYARRLLKETGMPMKDIVRRVGYIDVAAFRRKFKAAYGYNPSALRKKIQNMQK